MTNPDRMTIMEDSTAADSIEADSNHRERVSFAGEIR
jgi:hypothetical protein